MKTEDVKQLKPVDRFLYWIKERHKIHLARQRKAPKPWTDDVILQSFFFTNPYRENDKTTVWFRREVRDPLKDDPAVLFATVCFRWFNLISTGTILKENGWLLDWDEKAVVEHLGRLRDSGDKIFTGAFMINSPAREPKLEAICRRVTSVWDEREHMLRQWEADTSEGDRIDLAGFHSALTTFDGMGGFMAYEVVCDLRYTYLLREAPDILTWCNPGPGCVRGLCRILGIDFEKGRNAHGFTPKVPIDIQHECRQLLALCRRELKGMPLFEMREVEHSLCEYDKYERALWNDGRMKRTYRGV